MMRWIGLVLALSAVLLGGTAPAKDLDYLYVEPDMGNSSGGHVAIRFGDRVYHFQNSAGDTLRLVRSDYEHFRWVYTVVQNRTVHVARLDIPEHAYDTLLDRFNSRYLVQRKHFDMLASLQRDRALVDALAARPRVRARGCGVASPIPLRGAGFFYDARGVERHDEAAALMRLRQRIDDVYGTGFLPARLRDVSRRIRELSPGPWTPYTGEISKDDYPKAAYRFADRWIDLTLKMLALKVLTRGRAVRPDALVTSPDEDFVLRERERPVLQALHRRLAARLVQLVNSRRPDWGFAFLLGMARLVALEASLASRRLVVLDGFPADAPTIAAEKAEHHEFLMELVAHARHDFLAVRRRVFSRHDLDERTFHALEEAANRYAEIRRGLLEGRPVRLHLGTLIPSRAIMGLPVELPALHETQIRHAEAVLQHAEHTYRDRLYAAYGYRLLHHNCVSAIFDTIDAALGRQASVDALGGHVDPRAYGGFNAIPAVSFRAVVDAYDVVARGQVPSYRTTRLHDAYAQEPFLKTYLRESNTLTSTIYRHNDEDGLFIFFTDDAVLPRPLFGAVNLVAGLFETVIGVLRAPFDQGKAVWSGMKNTAFSLPELVFINLRKGTLEYGPGITPRTQLQMHPHPPLMSGR
jgi:hypothetical protein